MRRMLVMQFVIVVLLSGYSAAAEDPATVFGSVNWIKGPATANIGSLADIKVEDGYIFADGNDTRRLLEAMQNVTNGDELGLLGTADLGHFVVFEFDKIGYVKDEEKGSLDADAMLASIKKGTEESNKEREKRGWDAMTVLGWEIPPHYNSDTQNLEWALQYATKEGKIINFNTRYLGRNGVMRVTLVTEPQEFQNVLPKFRTIMTGFSYQQGHRYAEYVQGDQVAKYGLSALVVGGAAAAAVKSGFAKYIGKIIIGIGIAIAALFKKITGFFGKKSTD